MSKLLMIVVSILIIIIGWWGIGSDGALATPYAAVVLIVLIWKCYNDYQFKKEIKARLQMDNEKNKNDE